MITHNDDDFNNDINFCYFCHVTPADNLIELELDNEVWICDECLNKRIQSKTLRIMDKAEEIASMSGVTYEQALQSLIANY